MAAKNEQRSSVYNSAHFGDAVEGLAQSNPTPTPSGYVHLFQTEVRGMSEELIQTYRTGGGGGVALLAELNGHPGPRHILDLADDLELTSEQLEQIQALIDVIQPEAIQIGEAILAGEAALEEAFRQQTIDERSLEARLTNLGTLQAELRFIHLRTHLATVEILTPDQIERYNIVRGYAAENSSQGQHGNHRITQNAD